VVAQAGNITSQLAGWRKILLAAHSSENHFPSFLLGFFGEEIAHEFR
jgi:hypothetical protein